MLKPETRKKQKAALCWDKDENMLLSKCRNALMTAPLGVPERVMEP